MWNSLSPKIFPCEISFNLQNHSKKYNCQWNMLLNYIQLNLISNKGHLKMLTICFVWSIVTVDITITPPTSWDTFLSILTLEQIDRTFFNTVFFIWSIMTVGVTAIASITTFDTLSIFAFPSIIGTGVIFTIVFVWSVKTLIISITSQPIWKTWYGPIMVPRTFATKCVIFTVFFIRSIWTVRSSTITFVPTRDTLFTIFATKLTVNLIHHQYDHRCCDSKEEKNLVCRHFCSNPEKRSAVD